MSEEEKGEKPSDIVCVLRAIQEMFERDRERAEKRCLAIKEEVDRLSGNEY